jgi:hypothetical protein
MSRSLSVFWIAVAIVLAIVGLLAVWLAFRGERDVERLRKNP